MNIVILSRNPKLYSTSRLVEACKKRGHDPHVFDTLKFSIFVEGGNPTLHYNTRPFDDPDAVIPRIGASITMYGTAVVRQFEQMGVFCLTASHAITVSRDKLRSIQIMSRHRIGLPKTAFVRMKSAVLPAITEVGGAPVVIKLLEGTQGIGVILADQTKIAEAIIETLQSTRQNVLIQSFVKESRGRDIRAFVVGGKVVAAMRRTASDGEFRANVHRGASAEGIKLEPDYEHAALQAAQIMGLRVAGVDMLESKDGPLILEVNSSPGLFGIETATGVDVAGEIVKHIEEEVLFPEVDIRQRLTLHSGYGVSEIPVTPTSPMVGKALRQIGLREKDILVLSIMRGSVTLPNPRGDDQVMSGDTLVCFGKLLALRGLLPPTPQKRVKRKTTAKTK
ncbi:MAG: RimK family alpha-L-glutamate ligase [Planctomycetes bacterium]|nr:RimK family alpha-L-glutamate ligase [Planctomycetota bacterium]NUQ33488.1 RimK family alpha-L-glutamate ligase [Planctomycetaceae bacterium]